MRKTISTLLLAMLTISIGAKTETEPAPVSERPRILITTDIGGTDPDDNQSMMHYLLYCNEFDCEGLISSPSFGEGNKSEILRMIDIYEMDLPKLKLHNQEARAPYALYPSPEYLRSITKQGRHGRVPLAGYSTPTEGSEWIVRCANKQTHRPLYILVWGGLDDVAQALHDAPEIAKKIRIYWIGGPNKKWGINAYTYIIENFPDIWMIENNSTYRGFIAKYKNPDRWNGGFYDYYVKGNGYLGADFYNYLQGKPKLGDTPSLLYMMDGDPANPERESWGGSFEDIPTLRAMCSIIPPQLKTPHRSTPSSNGTSRVLHPRTLRWAMSASR